MRINVQLVHETRLRPHQFDSLFPITLGFKNHDGLLFIDNDIKNFQKSQNQSSIATTRPTGSYGLSL